MLRDFIRLSYFNIPITNSPEMLLSCLTNHFDHKSHDRFVHGLLLIVRAPSLLLQIQFRFSLCDTECEHTVSKPVPLSFTFKCCTSGRVKGL